MSGRSCLHKLLIFLSNVVQALNSKAQLDVIYLDLQKPFDTAPINVRPHHPPLGRVGAVVPVWLPQGLGFTLNLINTTS